VNAVQPTQTVLFVCPHGAGKSRMAAAYFNAAPPAGWTGTTAGLHPGEAVSPVAVRLLAGSPEAATLDHEQPRALEAIPQVDVLVSIDCDAEAETPAAASGALHVRWDLTTRTMDENMRDELRDRVAALANDLGSVSRPRR
jgi:protein-tyrosine-phosphatase